MSTANALSSPTDTVAPREADVVLCGSGLVKKLILDKSICPKNIDEYDILSLYGPGTDTNYDAVPALFSKGEIMSLMVAYCSVNPTCTF